MNADRFGISGWSFKVYNKTWRLLHHAQIRLKKNLRYSIIAPMQLLKLLYNDFSLKK